MQYGIKGPKEKIPRREMVFLKDWPLPEWTCVFWIKWQNSKDNFLGICNVIYGKCEMDILKWSYQERVQYNVVTCLNKNKYLYE